MWTQNDPRLVHQGLNSVNTSTSAIQVAYKVKVSPLQAMKAHGRCGCKDLHTVYAATAIGRGRVTSPMLGRDRTRAVRPVAKRLAS